jgi:menaquinone reductase, multiheme cytochrome c subunit
VLKPGSLRFLAGLCFSLIIGWYVFPFALYEKIEQPIQFSHKVHTAETSGLTCTDCHEIKADGRFSGIPTLEKCATCHSSAIGTSAREQVLVDEYVAKNREIPWLIYAKQPQNVYFSHTSHVKLAALECKECHGSHALSDSLRPFYRNRISGYSRDIWGSSISRINRTVGEGAKMDDCSDCHERRHVANTCLKCHK